MSRIAGRQMDGATAAGGRDAAVVWMRLVGGESFRRVCQGYSRRRTPQLQVQGASARVRLTHPTFPNDANNAEEQLLREVAQFILYLTEAVAVSLKVGIDSVPVSNAFS